MPVAGAVIGGVAAIGGAVLSSKAQKKAAKTAANAQKEASAQELQIAKMQEALYREMYAKNEKNFTPYLNSGYGAQSVAMQLLGLKPMTADQYNSGQWYVPGSVDYQSQQPAPTTPTPTTPTPTTPAPSAQTFAELEDAWAQQALSNLMPHIGPKRTAKSSRYSDPSDKLAYLQGVLHSDERRIYNSWTGSNPRPSNTPTTPTTPVPATPTPATGATNFAATPAQGPNLSAAQSTQTPQQQAQAAIAAGADPVQVNARLASMGFGSGVNIQ